VFVPKPSTTGYTGTELTYATVCVPRNNSTGVPGRIRSANGSGTLPDSPEEIFLPFSLQEIAQLPVGKFSLGVPLRQDVIQVGRFNECEIGSIVLTTDERRATTISREDNIPLQASIVTRQRDFVSKAEPILDAHVFEVPVD
jgi:hypothetical protein